STRSSQTRRLRSPRAKNADVANRSDPPPALIWIKAPGCGLVQAAAVPTVLKNPRRVVAGGKTPEEMVKLAACCFRHAKIATNAEAAEHLREVGETLLAKARRLNPAIQRPET